MKLSATTSILGNRRQQGAVLIISLMILLIMTVLGIAAMSSTTMEEKMAANNQLRQQAFQAAETALRDGEAWLFNNVTTVADLADFDGNTPGLYSVRPYTIGAALAEPAFNIYDGSAWTTGNSSPSHSLLTDQPQPRYIIEYLGNTESAPLDPTQPVGPQRYSFRITAIGWSVGGTSRYMAWSHYRRRLN